MSTEQVQETTEDVVTETETDNGPFVVNTDTSINATLDEIDDPKTLKQMVKKLRGENAKARTEKQQLKTQAEKWAEYEESQKTELEKLQTRLAAAEERATQKAREAILRQHGIDPDDDLAEFITGTEEEMEKKAEKLASRLKKDSVVEDKPATLSPQGFGSLDRQPVRTKKSSGASFLENLMNNS